MLAGRASSMFARLDVYSMFARCLLDVCSTFGRRLLDVCSTFARSCKRGTRQKNGPLLQKVVHLLAAVLDIGSKVIRQHRQQITGQQRLLAHETLITKTTTTATNLQTTRQHSRSVHAANTSFVQKFQKLQQTERLYFLVCCS